MKHYLLKTCLAMLCLVLGVGSAWAEEIVIYNETFGKPSANTSISNYTGWSSSFITPVGIGTADVRTTNASTGYTDASGEGNVLINATTEGIQFNFSDKLKSYTSVKLKMGIKKATKANTAIQLKCYFSNDGGTTWDTTDKFGGYSTKGAAWFLCDEIDIPAEYLNNFSFKITSTGTNTECIDDVTITGVSNGGGSTPDPGTGGGDPDPGTGNVDPEPSNLALALSLDFSNAGVVWGMPSSKTVTSKTFTSGGYSVTMQGSTGEGYNFQTSNNNVLLGKSGATITLPTLPFAVKKIEIVGPASGASTKVTQNIYVGENAVSTETTDANGTHSYVIADANQAVGTQYILKVTNDYSTQFNTINFYAENGDANVPTYYNVTIHNEITNGKVSANASSYVVAGSTVALKANPSLGYEFSAWIVTDASSNPIAVTDNQFVMPASNVTVSATFTAIPDSKAFDLTTSLTDQGATVSDDNITFSQTRFTLDFAKNGGMKVTNYCPHSSTVRNVTRLYEKNIVSVTPVTGYVVKYLLVHLNSSSSGQSSWSGGTLNNCIVTTGNASNGNPGWVMVTPIDGTSAFSVQLSNTTAMDAMLVVYGEAKTTITLNAACHDESDIVYGTYSSTSAWVVPTDIEVSEVLVQDGEISLWKYDEGAIVPANTGVLVAALEGGDYEVNLTSEAGESVLKTSNCLRPTGAGITADEMAAADADVEYFRLTMHNGTKIGFWWGAEDGAAFALGANKAYLVAPVPAAGGSSNMRGLWFNEGGKPTGIEAVKTTNDNVIYNLQGQRVSRLQQGVNIVNGKKVIR